MFFSACGYRNYGSGHVSYISEYGFYWTAGPESVDATDGRNWEFNSDDIRPLSSFYRSNGYAVRCAQEKE
ncbi:MAG: hypothetical protein ACTTGX_06450 [Candidatus Cryptobacteroides sp.]